MKSSCFALFLLLSLFSFALLQTSASRQGLNSVAISLNAFQNANGGFRNSGDPSSTLDGTASALFLASLLGESHTFDAESALNFLNTYEVSDLDLASIRQLALSYHYLKKAAPSAEKIQQHLQSLYDSKSKLFASTEGGKGDLKSTALVFDTLRLLGAVKGGAFKDNIAALKTYLSAHEVIAEQAQFSFPEESGLNVIEQNYYAVLLGSAIDFEFNLPKLAHFIASFQNKEGANAGGFFSNKEKNTVSFESTYQAATALLILQQHYEKEQFFNRLDQDLLVKYATSIPASSLTDTAKAFTVISTTKKFFTEFLDAKFVYEVLGGVPGGSTVIQGTQLKPVIQAKSLDGTPRSDLSAEVVVSLANGSPSKVKLDWNKDSQQYVASKYIDTSFLLGPLVLDYTLSAAVPGIGETHVRQTIERKIGYGITVDSQATVDATGKKVEKGEAISLGTAFKFAVSLHNKTHDNFSSGKFFVTFSVLESSGVSIHQETVDASKSGAAFTFSYTLSSPRIPAGELAFRFEVSDDKKKVHSSETVSYQLVTPMIASEILFEGASSTFKIGQKVKVSMVPATFPDFRTVQKLDGNENAAQARKFFLDTKTAAGTLLHSVKGVPSGGKYVFEFTISNTFEFVGTNAISFRYVAANGEDIALSNYDSSAQELYEDPSALSYTVNAALELVDISAQPKADSFSYGNEINYKFRVRDSVSGQNLVASSNFETATVFLSLSNEEKSGRVSRSVHIPAVSTGNDFSISWVINLNAVQGPGVVTISAEDADGNPIPIVEEKTKKPIQYNVNIGGAIEVDAHPYVVSTLLVDEAAFVVEFSLFCQSRRLKEAQLRANVVVNGGAEPLLSMVPVVTNSDGSYSVSWTVPLKKEQSGHYQLQFFREADARANSSPLFVVDFDHSSGLKTLPVATEFLVAIIVGAAFLTLSYKRSQLANTAPVK